MVRGVPWRAWLLIRSIYHLCYPLVRALESTQHTILAFCSKWELLQYLVWYALRCSNLQPMSGRLPSKSEVGHEYGQIITLLSQEFLKVFPSSPEVRYLRLSCPLKSSRDLALKQD